MAMATGKKIMTTTTLGKMIDKTVEAINHTKTWLLSDVPIRQREPIAKRRSKWVFSHVSEINSDPKRSTTISEKY